MQWVCIWKNAQEIFFHWTLERHSHWPFDSLGPMRTDASLNAKWIEILPAIYWRLQRVENCLLPEKQISNQWMHQRFPQPTPWWNWQLPRDTQNGQRWRVLQQRTSRVAQQERCQTWDQRPAHTGAERSFGTSQSHSSWSSTQYAPCKETTPVPVGRSHRMRRIHTKSRHLKGSPTHAVLRLAQIETWCKQPTHLWLHRFCPHSSSWKTKTGSEKCQNYLRRLLPNTKGSSLLGSSRTKSEDQPWCHILRELPGWRLPTLTTRPATQPAGWGGVWRPFSINLSPGHPESTS